jgi:hypothetical protein
VLDQKETEVTLAALRLRRAEIEAWLEGPAKKATLSALDRVIAELEREKERSVEVPAAAQATAVPSDGPVVARPLVPARGPGRIS